MASKPGTFGPAIIGAKRAREERRTVAERRNRFGPAVAGRKHGPLVTDPLPWEEGEGEAESPDDAPETGKPPAVLRAAGEDGYMSVPELKAALEAHPEKLDTFLDYEFEREGGARVTALRELLAVEMQREAGARDPVVARIEGAL